jgi:dihydropteroate synthase
MIVRLLHSNYLPDLLSELRFSGIEPDESDRNSLKFSPVVIKIDEVTPAQQNYLCGLFFAENLWCRSSLPTASLAVFTALPDGNLLEKFIQTSAATVPDFAEQMVNLKLGIEKNSWEFKIQRGILSVDRPLIMAILNVTPDSFSDGGQYFDPVKACDYALQMCEAGADIIDIGAESTRPGAQAVEPEEEWQRLQPVLKMLAAQVKPALSVDTYKAEIASRALQEGADMINDISGLTFDPKMVGVISRWNCPLVIMHIQGTPRTMQQNPSYDNLMEEIFKFFKSQIQLAEDHDIRQLIVDPGLGFGKRYEDNFEIIRRLGEFRILGYPVMVGPSRKSFIGKTLNVSADDRLMGTVATVSAAVLNGATMVRVHDVKEIKQTLEILREIYP